MRGVTASRPSSSGRIWRQQALIQARAAALECP
ncbi:MAG: hypothetical protein JWP38_1924, partial [Herbaspirillum sp.]|nr:hypothetical protein [Herbaspirillum sp.]